MELDIVDVSSANIVLETKFGEETLTEETQNDIDSYRLHCYRSKVIDQVDISFEKGFGEEAQPEEVCSEPPEIQMVYVAHWMDNSF